VSPATLFGVLAGGQLALVALDLLDSHRHPGEIPGAGRLQPRTAAFLAGTILVYGALQYAGLALAPTGAELLASTQGLLAPVDATRRPVPLSPWLATLVGICAFYAAGFWDYVVHRYVNHDPRLWFTHEYHHLPTRVTTYMPGICVRPLAVVAVLPATAATVLTVCLALATVGLAGAELTGVLQAVVLAQVTLLGTSHSSYLRRHAWMHRLLRPLGLTTPQEHWLHHAPDLHGNFGNFTTLWDRVFGTYLDPLDPAHRRSRAGLGYDQDFLGTLTFGRVKLSARQREYFGLQRYCYLSAPVHGAGVHDVRAGIERGLE
jgi:sterol desaturase/sphingolipid hydroxylase (fatty acid hydroxylase superfamily)